MLMPLRSEKQTPLVVLVLSNLLSKLVPLHLAAAWLASGGQHGVPIALFPSRPRSWKRRKVGLAASITYTTTNISGRAGTMSNEGFEKMKWEIEAHMNRT